MDQLTVRPRHQPAETTVTVHQIADAGELSAFIPGIGVLAVIDEAAKRIVLNAERSRSSATPDQECESACPAISGSSRIPLSQSREEVKESRSKILASWRPQVSHCLVVWPL